MNAPITTFTLFYFKKNKLWAFKQMGIRNYFLKKIPGLIFYRLLGTGGGNGFSLIPDFSTYAFLGVWKNKEDYVKFSNNNQIYLSYKKKSFKHRNLILKLVKSHGKWSGMNPFVNEKKKDYLNKSLDKKIVVITRATLKWNKLFSFWMAVPFASRAINKAKGVLFYKGIGEWPFIQQATISIWDNFEAVNMFAYKNFQHAKIVKKTRQNKWYKEDLFSRFYLISDKTKN